MVRVLSLSYMAAGFVAVLVGYTGAMAIVFQAAAATGASEAEISSWLWALGLGMGISGIGLSFYYRQPILIAWSTPGAALLVTSLSGVSLPQAVGAFLFCSALILLSGVTGWFDRLTKLIPRSLASAMLAGVLLQFGLNAFSALAEGFELAAGMLAAYLLGKLFWSRYCIPVTFLAGMMIAIGLGELDGLDISLSLTRPVFIWPEFDLSVLIGIGIPLFIVTMASQNLPGIAVLRAHGYRAPASTLISWTGVTGLLLAPFGGFAFNMAAITAAICMGREVDEKPERCYPAAIWAGIFYVLVGLFGAAVAALFAAFPQALIMAIAGLALLGTISGSLNSALEDTDQREAAMLCFAMTASGVSLASIGAPFWGLLLGIAVDRLMRWKRGRERKLQQA